MERNAIFIGGHNWPLHMTVWHIHFNGGFLFGGTERQRLSGANVHEALVWLGLGHLCFHACVWIGGLESFQS